MTNIQEEKSGSVSIDFVVVCDLAQITQDGKLSIIGIFEQIFSERFPLRYPRFFIVGVITGEPFSKHTLSFSITDPNGDEVIREFEMATSLGFNGKANVLSDLTGTVFKGLGQHTVTMKIDRIVTRSTTFMIVAGNQSPMKRESKIVN